MQSIHELERRLAGMVAAASGELVSARFSMHEFRESIAEVLSGTREDQRAHGLDENKPFFDLTMFDANPVEPAVFLVSMFFPDTLTIFVGSDLPSEIIKMVNQFAMADVEGMTAA